MLEGENSVTSWQRCAFPLLVAEPLWGLPHGLDRLPAKTVSHVALRSRFGLTMAGQGSDQGGPLLYFSGETEGGKEYKRWKAWAKNKLLTLEAARKVSWCLHLYLAQRQGVGDSGAPRSL